MITDDQWNEIMKLQGNHKCDTHEDRDAVIFVMVKEEYKRVCSECMVQWESEHVSQ